MVAESSTADERPARTIAKLTHHRPNLPSLDPQSGPAADPRRDERTSES